MGLPFALQKAVFRALYGTPKGMKYAPYSFDKPEKCQLQTVISI